MMFNPSPRPQLVPTLKDLTRLSARRIPHPLAIRAQHPSCRLEITRRLTRSFTTRLMGGIKRGTAMTPAVKIMDVTAPVLELHPDIVQHIKVAAVHIGIAKVMLKQVSKTQGFTERRMILIARAMLQQMGYTHIAVTGPWRIYIETREPLVPIATYRNHRALASYCAWFYRISLRFWMISLIGPARKHRRQRLKDLITSAKDGFAYTTIFEL